jgi:polygalacturonase
LKALKSLLILQILTVGICHAQMTSVFDIRTFGAVGDGVTSDTKPLQAAIDKCSVNDGGMVLVAGGRYVTGTFYLKSNVTLRVEADAMILGSTNIADYTTDTDRTMYNEPYMNRCLIFARDAKNISIEGGGVIDGRGKSFPNKGDREKNRPKIIRLLNCSHIRVRDITLQWPASWTSEWRYCDDLAFDKVTIMSRGISNGDGLDFDGCTRVRVNNSNFNCGDDCVCLQTSLTNKPCKNVFIADCGFSGRWPEIGSLRKIIPARGLFAHHVKGITLHNVELGTKTTDACPAVVFQDVVEIKTDDSPVPTMLP